MSGSRGTWNRHRRRWRRSSRGSWQPGRCRSFWAADTRRLSAVISGYAAAAMPVGIVNIDAHLDVRPCLDGRGNSGTPFRQAMEHPSPRCRDRVMCVWECRGM